VALAAAFGVGCFAGVLMGLVVGFAAALRFERLGLLLAALAARSACCCFACDSIDAQTVQTKTRKHIKKSVIVKYNLVVSE